jgi:hypothetical protein
MLTRVDIKSRVASLQAEVRAKSDITKERVLGELEAIMDSKISDYLDFDGLFLKFKPFSELTDKQIRAVEAIKETKYGVELKLHGKNWTIERICKMLGFDAPIKGEISTDFGAFLQRINTVG